MKNKNILDIKLKIDIILNNMKIKKNHSNETASNYKAFNATLVETKDGFKVVGAFGANSVDADENQWKRIDSRYFSRALSKAKLVTR